MVILPSKPPKQIDSLGQELEISTSETRPSKSSLYGTARFEHCLKQIQWQHLSHVRHLRDVELAHREIEACFGFVVVVVALQTCSPYLFGKCQDRILTN
jgi:hypothetical protein